MRPAQRHIGMNRFEAMGIGRSLEPVNSILQPAWKIDNDMRLRPGELTHRRENH